MKISKRKTASMISLAALLLLGVAQAGITKDNDMNHMHGDPKEYVKAMREKQS